MATSVLWRKIHNIFKNITKSDNEFGSLESLKTVIYILNKNFVKNINGSFCPGASKHAKKFKMQKKSNLFVLHCTILSKKLKIVMMTFARILYIYLKHYATGILGSSQVKMQIFIF